MNEELTIDNLDPMFKGPLRPSLVTVPSRLGKWEPAPIPEHHNVWTVPWDAYGSALAGIVDCWGEYADTIIAHLTITRKEWESGDYSEDLVRLLEWNVNPNQWYCTGNLVPGNVLYRKQHHHMLGGDGTTSEVAFSPSKE